MVEEVTLDDARDHIYTALRACERFAESLRRVAEGLDKKQNEDEWLEEVATNSQKAISFHQVQENSWQQFSTKMQTFIEALKQEAEALAIAELKGNTDGPEFQSLIQRRETKTLHPELHKFKLEKHAKILGMGGAPAVGSGMVLPKLSGKGSVLKATGSAAAREIYYSKVEDKDARYLKEVMQFHTPKSAEKEKAAWQQEVQTRHIAHRGTPDSTPTPTPAMVTPLTGELSDRLAARAAKLTEHEETSQQAQRLQQASASAIPTTPELEAALRKRQAELAQAAATPEPSTPPNRIMHNTSATPYGSELSSALQRRAQQAQQAPTPSSSTPPVNPLAGASNELESVLARRQNALKQEEENRDSDEGESSGSRASTRTPPPYNPALANRTPMSDMVNAELAAKLRRRQQDGEQ